MAHTISGASLSDIQQRLNTTENYHPLDADTFSDWSMQAGDTVTLSRGDENYTSPVHTLKTVWKGSPQTTISSTGNKEREAVSTQAKSKYSSSSGINNAQGIHSYVWNTESTIYSYIDQTATYIAQGVEDVENQLGSAILQTASAIRSEVHASNSALYSYIDQTATYIESVVADVNNDLGSAILQTASQIRSEVHASNSELYSYVDQTATYIESVVADVNNDLGSAILQTASQIRSEVHASNSELYSYVDQTATYIESVVASTESNLRSSINQQANKISMVVDGSGNIKAAQIVAAINDDGTSETLISANKITLDGETTLYGSLQVQNGDIYTVGNLYAGLGNDKYIQGKTLKLVGASSSQGAQIETLAAGDISSMIIKAEVDVSTNTLKLWQHGDDPTGTPSITFSKAASISSLTGDWSGNTLTVKTNPVIAGLNYTVGFGGSYNAHNTEFEVSSNGSLSVSELMGIKFLDAPIQVSYLTGASSAPVQVYTKDISFNPSSVLQAKTGTSKITANGTFTPGTDYIGFSSVEVDVQGGVTPEAPYGTAIDAYTEKKTGDVTSNGLNTTFTLSSGSYRPSGTTTDIAAVTLKLGSNDIGRINIPLTTQTATSNDTYTPPSGYVGFSKFTVNVPPETHQAPYGTAIDAYTQKTTGNVTSDGISSTFTLSSGTYRPTGTTTDIAAVTLQLGSNNIGRINIPLTTRTGSNKITSNNTYTPASGYVGFSKVEVDVPSDLGYAVSRFGSATGEYYIASYDNRSSTIISGSSVTYQLAASGNKVQIQNAGGTKIANTPEYTIPAVSPTVSLAWGNTGSTAGTTNSVTGTSNPSGTPATHYIGLSQDANFTSKKKNIYVKYATDASTVAQGGGTRIGMIEVNATSVYNDGSPTDITLGSKITGTTWNVSATRGDGTTFNDQIDLDSVYTDARSGYYTWSQFHITGAWDKTSSSLSRNNRVTITRTTDGSTNSLNYVISADASISYNSSTHTYTATAKAKVDGTTRGDDATATSGTEAYSAGWKAYHNTWKYPSTGTSNSMTVYWPSSTVDSSYDSISRSYKLSFSSTGDKVTLKYSGGTYAQIDGITDFDTTSPAGYQHNSSHKNSSGLQYRIISSGASGTAEIAVKGSIGLNGTNYERSSWLSDGPTALYRAAYAQGMSAGSSSITCTAFNALSTEGWKYTYDGHTYTNNSNGYSIYNGNVVIVVGGTVTVNGKSVSIPVNYLKGAPTAIYNEAYDADHDMFCTGPGSWNKVTSHTISPGQSYEIWPTFAKKGGSYQIGDTCTVTASQGTRFQLYCTKKTASYPGATVYDYTFELYSAGNTFNVNTSSPYNFYRH